MRSSNAPFATVSDNFYTSINVSNDLRTWLNDTDALKEISPSLTQKDVFTRWDRPIEALKQTSPGVSSCKREDANMIIGGQLPIHRWVEANTACSEGAYIGELNGHIGRLEDYYQDPRNRWEEMRHPEPFVFFHDRLPIYVDCREEGSVLRHVGRSCQANVKLQIIINGTDFHFCFISLREIAAGEELTVPWHIRDKELDVIRTINDNGNVRPEDEMHMSTWFTNVLANFGGCACSQHGTPCNLGRFDLRNKERLYMPTVAKPTKPRKIKRLPTQISPGSTGRATNSRAGSEAVIQGDNDEDMADSRSLSANSRSQPSSRDITPLMVDVGVGFGVAMSDRERRKLLQQEKLFEKMELDGQGARKGKRHSAGSALNTPNPSTSVSMKHSRTVIKTNTKQKQLGFPDSGNPSPTSASAGTGRPRANGTTPRAVNGTRVVHRPRPEMVSMPTQTDIDLSATSPSPPRRRRTGSQVSCLLRRVQLESKRRKERSASVMSQERKASPTPVIATKLEGTPSPIMKSMPPPPVPAILSGEQPKPDLLVQAPQLESKDVDMQDTPTTEEPIAPPEQMDTTQPAVSTASDTVVPTSSDLPIQPPAPPWPSDNPQSPIESPPSTRPTHVTLPPVPSFSVSAIADQAETLLTQSTPPDDLMPGTLRQPSAPFAQPPRPLGMSNSPDLSPSITHVVAPSPAKKKMSLGDWMKKKKKKDEVAQAQAQAQKDADAESNSAVDGNDEPKSDPLEPSSSAEADDANKLDAEVAVEDVDMPLAPLASETAAVPAAEETKEDDEKKDMAETTDAASTAAEFSAPTSS
jgi:hypothetical protein